MKSPKKIDKHVAAFIRKIAPGRMPRIVPVETMAGSTAGMCFHNCAKHNDLKGSETLYGWAIWEIKGHMLEAEHHAICNLDGRRFCVSPHPDGIRKILFVEDPGLGYDLSDRRSVKPNLYFNVSGSKLVDDLIEAREKLVSYVLDNMKPSGHTILNRAYFGLLQRDALIKFNRVTGGRP